MAHSRNWKDMKALDEKDRSRSSSPWPRKEKKLSMELEGLIGEVEGGYKH